MVDATGDGEGGISTAEPAPAPGDPGVDPGAGLGREARVRRAVATWMAQLIDTGGRNNLLFYRDLRSGTLDLRTAEPAAIGSLLAGRPVRLRSLFPVEEAHLEAVRRARHIHKRAQEFYEERGVWTLYLGCGLATWKNPRTETIPAAPVLLRPARLVARGAAADEFDLALGGEMEVNPTLLHYLKSEFGRTFDQQALLERVDGVIDTPDELGQAYRWLGDHAEGLPGFAIADRLVLATFSYAKLPMVRDLEAALPHLVAHDLVAALAGDAGARETLRARSAAAHAEADEPDRTAPLDEFLVLDADATQNLAINLVVQGSDLIVKGPPGTGKSQTIGNLIATCLARGERVLFVAEKRAAIDAVLRRLERVGLDDLVLDIHGGTGPRRQLAENLSRSLQAIATTPAPPHTSLAGDLAAVRSRLVETARALHAERQPWGVSVFEARSGVLGIGEADRTEVRFRAATLEALDGGTFEEIVRALREFVALGGPRLAASPWATAPIDRAEDGLAAFDAVAGARSATAEAIRSFGAAAAETGLSAPSTTADLSVLLGTWTGAADVLAVCAPEVFDADLDAVRRRLEPARSLLRRLLARAFSADYRAARRDVRALLLDPAVGDRRLLETLDTASTVARTWAERRQRPSAPRPPSDGGTLADAHARLVAVLDDVAGRIGRPLPADEPLAAVAAALDALLADRATLLRLPDVRRLRRALESAGLAQLLDELRDRPDGPDAAAARLEHAWLASIVESVEFADPVIATFDARRHEADVEVFRRLDRRHIEATPRRLRRRYAERAVAEKDRFPDEAALIRYQAGLKRRHLPLRELVAKAPNALLAVKPCWAMSPLVVSQVLPADRAWFDVVVFDEASQIPPADAIPSILRGTRLVVAGDDRQLPPTAFFLSAASEVDDEATEQNELDQAIELSATKGFESILDALAAFLPASMLRWHYRSEDERLIAFSNAEFYERGLVTFPGVLGGQVLRHVLVPWRASGEDQSESVSDEVRTVVDLVLEHAASRPDESLGVIAMGITHANRIEEALRERLRERRDLDAFFDEGRDERFFVKNLERVQGDERDSIILSVGYGKTADGRLLHRFGPINMQGGERRLNVAVTRARKQMAVVSSFSWQEMDPERLRSRGARLLRAYLAYAEGRGETAEAPAPPAVGADGRPLDSFASAVYEAVRARDLPAVSRLGSSGQAIDVAVRDRDEPGRFLLAVETDGPVYAAGQTSRDRDRLRPQVLERLGWSVHRVWSGEWWEARDRAVERVESAYAQALAAARRRAPQAPPAPPDEPASPARRPRPRIEPRSAIDDFRLHELVAIVDWIESDTLLRTEEDLLREAIVELGFARRGSRIEAAIREAIRMARAGRTAGRDS